MKFRLIEDIRSMVKDLNHGLRNLTFTNNVEGFEATVTISATSEATIRNELTFVPSRYIIMSQTGNGLLTKGTTEWSSDYLYIYNNGSVEVTATIFFMK